MSLSMDRDKLQTADTPTLYKQIRLDIERRILTGEWPPGHRIPFEHQLMARYGWCSNGMRWRSEEHTSELQSHLNLLSRLLLEKKTEQCKQQVVVSKRPATCARGGLHAPPQ